MVQPVLAKQLRHPGLGAVPWRAGQTRSVEGSQAPSAPLKKRSQVNDSIPQCPPLGTCPSSSEGHPQISPLPILWGTQQGCNPHGQEPHEHPSHIHTLLRNGGGSLYHLLGLAPRLVSHLWLFLSWQGPHCRATGCCSSPLLPVPRGPAGPAVRSGWLMGTGSLWGRGSGALAVQASGEQPRVGEND